MKIREELNRLVGKNVTVKIKDEDGYYFNDMSNQIFTKDDVNCYEDFCKNAYLYGIDYCNISNVYIIEIHE